jgi:hypothetical protein
MQAAHDVREPKPSTIIPVCGRERKEPRDGRRALREPAQADAHRASLQTAPCKCMHVIHENEEAAMALSVRLDPVLAARVEEESRRLGISKSDLVKDALELRLGLKNPYDLLLQARSGRRMGKPTASERTGDGLRAEAPGETFSLTQGR